MYYVYLHRLPNGRVFYVGKGTNKRAWSKHSRNSHWNRIVSKHGGFSVEIILNNLQEWYAFELETELIMQYGLTTEGGTLVNKSYGGEGISGYKFNEASKAKLSFLQRGTNNARADKSCYDFVNVITKEEYHGTRYDFEKKYGFRIADLFKRNDITTVYSWTTKDRLHLAIKPKYDPTVYYFRNRLTGQVLQATRRAFKEATGIDCKNLFKKNGKYAHVYNWELI